MHNYYGWRYGHANTATLLEKPMLLLEPFSGFLLLESVEPGGRYDVGGERGCLIYDSFF